MQWPLLLCSLLLLIQNAIALYPRSGSSRRSSVQRGQHQRVTGYVEQDTSNEQQQTQEGAAMAEDALSCPLGCACQYAHFLDLPISRWINYMQMRRLATATNQQRRPRSYDHDEDAAAEVPIMRGHRNAGGRSRRSSGASDNQLRWEHEEQAKVLIKRVASSNDNYFIDNNNEVTYEEHSDEEGMKTIDDEDLLSSTNPHIKQATCILQQETNVASLVQSLPHDLQALILLYTGIGRNKTVNVSDLKPLNQLSTLEIRGPDDRTMSLVFDEPLSFLQYANFESITLLRSDNFNRPKNPKHPSDSFNYKPKREFYGEEQLGAKKLDFRTLDAEPEILPYVEYMQRMKEARMPTFYGWERLDVLRIHSCQLSELYWEMFDGLQAVQHLSLERNGIKSLPPFALYGALHVKTLSLAHNHIPDLHYKALAGLLELRWLDLTDNRLTRLSEKSFPPLPKLERIDFRLNPLQHIYPATFWIMNGTREMYFGSNAVALELWSDAPFASLRQLRELVIGNVSIDSLEQNVFKGLINLEILQIKGDIRSIEFDAFAGLASLRELSLDYCGIQRLSMDAFMGCKQLVVVRLAHNKLTHIPVGLFDDQPHLAEVYLQGNQLRTLPSGFFRSPKLRLARLNDNPWQCSCDMQSWRSRVTNQQRATSTERCISDFRTGAIISCRQIAEEQFDRRLAPRCSNFNGRSVFYVLRQQLQCGPGRLVRSRTSSDMATQLENSRQQRREQKQRIKTAQRNTLQYTLHEQQRQAAAMAAKHAQEEEDQISNDI